MLELDPRNTKYPTVDALGCQLSVTEWLPFPWATPAPESEIFSAEFEALLATSSCPVELPADFGWKLTEIVSDWFGPRTALEFELTTNPVPDAFTLEMFTLWLPAAVMVTSWEVDAPTVTFPKATEVELGES